MPLEQKRSHLNRPGQSRNPSRNSLCSSDLKRHGSRPGEISNSRRHQFILLACAVTLICGCQLLRQVERNTGAIDENRNAIEKTTESIQKNASAVDQSTEQIGENSEAILANAKQIESSTRSLEKIQMAAAESTKAILENQTAISSNTRAIIENERTVRASTDSILKNKKAIEEIDAWLNRFADHKALVLLVLIAFGILVIAPYVALCIMLARLQRLIRSLPSNASQH